MYGRLIQLLLEPNWGTTLDNRTIHHIYCIRSFITPKIISKYNSLSPCPGYVRVQVPRNSQPKWFEHWPGGLTYVFRTVLKTLVLFLVRKRSYWPYIDIFSCLSLRTFHYTRVWTVWTQLNIPPKIFFNSVLLSKSKGENYFICML